MVHELLLLLCLSLVHHLMSSSNFIAKVFNFTVLDGQPRLWNPRQFDSHHRMAMNSTMGPFNSPRPWMSLGIAPSPFRGPFGSFSSFGPRPAPIQSSGFRPPWTFSAAAPPPGPSYSQYNHFKPRY